MAKQESVVHLDQVIDRLLSIAEKDESKALLTQLKAELQSETQQQKKVSVMKGE